MNLFKKKSKFIEHPDTIKERKKDKRKRWLILLAFVIFMGFFSKYVLQFPIVFGASMEPTLQDQDILMINKFAYQESEDVQRNDIIVFKNHEKNCYLIKRVYGLPGETVRIDQDGNIFINDKMIEDSYGMGNTEPGQALFAITLKTDEFFVLGDNRENSDDSRTEWVGVVNLDDIDGKITHRLYPNYTSFEKEQTSSLKTNKHSNKK